MLYEPTVAPVREIEPGWWVAVFGTPLPVERVLFDTPAPGAVTLTFWDNLGQFMAYAAVEVAAFRPRERLRLQGSSQNPYTE